MVRKFYVHEKIISFNLVQYKPDYISCIVLGNFYTLRLNQELELKNVYCSQGDTLRMGMALYARLKKPIFNWYKIQQSRLQEILKKQNRPYQEKLLMKWHVWLQEISLDFLETYL